MECTFKTDDICLRVSTSLLAEFSGELQSRFVRFGARVGEEDFLEWGLWRVGFSCFDDEFG